VAERLDETMLDELERQHVAGMTSVQILECLERMDIKFSEATLRKYVQLGLLPRSVRVGRKGKHQGSQGMYPPGVIRQVLRIRDMMAQNFTIEQIQREFLFVRSDIEELERVVDRIFSTLDKSARNTAVDGPSARAVFQEIAGAKALSRDLVRKLETIEARLTARAKLTRTAAG
jgi:hypothetical protein